MPLKLDGTYGVYGVVGTASSAAFYGDDADSGIIFPDANTVAVVTNGSERVRVGAAGSVGIGTNNPSSTVDILGLPANTGSTSASVPTGTLRLSTDTGSNSGTYGASLVFTQKWFSGNKEQIAVGQIAGVKTRGDGNFGGGLTFFTSNGTSNDLLERMRIDEVGRMTLPYQPAFYAYPSSNILRSAAGQYTWQFDTTVFNVGGHFNTSTYRFTAPVAGRYLFGTNVRIDGADIDYFRTHFLVNGSAGTYKTIGHAIADLGTTWDPRYYSFSVTHFASLNASDYVEVASVSNTDASWTQYYESQFWGYLVG